MIAHEEQQFWGCRVETAAHSFIEFASGMPSSTMAGDLVISRMTSCTNDPIAWFAAGQWLGAVLVLLSERT